MPKEPTTENFCRDCAYVNQAGNSRPSFWECQRTSGRNYISGAKEFPFCRAVRGRGRCCPDFKPSPIQNCTFTADEAQGVTAPAP